MDARPLSRDRDMTTRYTTCPLCEALCGLEIEIDDDRITGDVRGLQTLTDIVEQVYDRLAANFATESGYIALYDAQQRQLTFPVLKENGQTLTGEPISSLDDRSMAAWVAVNNRAYVTGNWADDDKPVPGIHLHAETASMMVVPTDTIPAAFSLATTVAS